MTTTEAKQDFSNVDLYLDRYGARLFPLCPRTQIGDDICKKPYKEDWPNANFSRAELLKYWEDGHPIAWALGPGDLVVDVDAPTPDRPEKKGLESLKRLEKILSIKFEALGTIEVQSPSGGRHFYFTKPADLLIRKKVKELPDIEFLSHGCYVVIAGSPHWQGGNYEAPMAEMLERLPAPAGLLGMLKRDAIEGKEATEAKRISVEHLERALAALEVTDYRDHDDWFALMAAIHSATGGSQKGLEAFIAWSTKDPNYAGAAGEISNRWQTLKDRSGGITVGTLLAELRAAGADDLAKEIEVSIDFDEEVRKKITWSTNYKAMNEEILAEMDRLGEICSTAGALMRLRRNERGMVHRQLLTKAVLLQELSSLVDLRKYKRTKDGQLSDSPVAVTPMMASMILERGEWPTVKQIDYIFDRPFLNHKGEVISSNGYHADALAFLELGQEFPQVPKQPTKEQAQSAANLIMDLVCDFPFEGEVDRSGWFALVLTLLGRNVIRGRVPLFFMEANKAGSGKSHLVKLASIIALGQYPPENAYPESDEEMRKTILGLIEQPREIMLFDNVPNGGPFGFPSLDQAITSAELSGRVLGANRAISGRVDTVFCATGNKLQLARGADAWRRLVAVMLTSRDENPSARIDFKYGQDNELFDYALTNRPALVAAGLTILAYQIQNGCRSEIRPRGGFAEWSKLIRGAIVNLGMADPDQCLDRLAKESAPAQTDTAILIDYMRDAGFIGEANSVKAQEILERLGYMANGYHSNIFPEGPEKESARALVDMLEGFRKGTGATQRIGYKLRDAAKIPCEGWWLTSKEIRRSKSYWVEPLR